MYDFILEVRIMKKLSSVLCGGLFVIIFSVCSVKADEISDLKKQLADMQARIEQLEAQQKKVIAEEVSKAVEKKQVSALPDSIKWVEKVKISGDFRYRYDNIDAESGGEWTKGVNRNRIRARLNIIGKVNDEVDLGFRIASGSADPVSTNQDLENSFSSKDIWLDRAYFDWHPDMFTGFSFIGGKIPNPFYTAGDNQLIWDADLNPEGLAVKYEKAMNDNCTFYLNGGGFWVDEDPSSSSKTDTSLWGIQSYIKQKFEDSSHLIGGISYYDYGNLENQPDLSSRWGSSKWFGNNVNAAGTGYATDFDILEVFGEYGFKLNEMPVVVFGSYVDNLAANKQDKGWLVGCSLNKAKDPGSWALSYNYRDLEEDAVVGQFSESDFIGGGTDGKGHVFSGQYQIAKNLQAALTYYLNTIKNSDDDSYRRLQADLILKF
jgi:hypothetical protein